jgi:MFS family permease
LLATIRQRNFALLWFGGLISIIGDWVIIATLPFFIYNITGSALASSGLLVAYTLPGLLFGSLAGVFVDRWDRRRTMIVANLLRAPLMLLLLMVQDAAWVPVIYFVTFIESTIGQFFGPAENALLPRLVAEEQLLAANALNTLNNNLARLLGPSLGAATFAVIGLPGVVVLDSVSYLASALMIGLIAIGSTRAKGAERSQAPVALISLVIVWHEWREGLLLVKRNRLVTAIFVILGAAAIADSFNSALLVPFVKEMLQGSTQEFAWLLTAQAVSGIGAGFLVGHISGRIGPGPMIALSAGVAGVLFMIAYNVPVLWLVLFVATILGFPSVGFYVGAQTLLQSSVADQYRGRVFGALGTTNALLALVTLGLGGALADRLGVRPVLNVVVVLWLCTAILAWVRLRNTGAHEPMTALAEIPPGMDGT